jgi:hypothetical protein
MIKLPAILAGIALAASSCATGTGSPGATLLTGITQYQGEMQRLGSSPARWPERQRAGGTLKTVITATVGVSPEFYRLVDLDLRKREFAVTIRETSVRPERLKEMQEELAQMNDEIAALKPVIRSQLAALRLQEGPERGVEDAAVRGLISLSLEGFSANGGFGGRSTKVGGFTVTDMGSFSVVQAPDGRPFRCSLYGMPEDGAGVRCNPLE